MKILSAAALAMVLCGPLQAQTGSVAPAASSVLTPAKIDPAKEADIRHLLDVMGTTAVMQRMMGSMEESIKPLMANSLPPGEYRSQLIDLFFQKFSSKFDQKVLFDVAVKRYDENFSDEEIKGLIAFYGTPLGHKVTTVLPTLTQQLQQDGQKMGQRLGQESMQEVLKEHPEIAQQLEEASHQPAALASGTR